MEILLGRNGEEERAGEGLRWEEVLSAERAVEGERGNETGSHAEVMR